MLAVLGRIVQGHSSADRSGSYCTGPFQCRPFWVVLYRAILVLTVLGRTVQDHCAGPSSELIFLGRIFQDHSSADVSGSYGTGLFDRIITVLTFQGRMFPDQSSTRGLCGWRIQELSSGSLSLSGTHQVPCHPLPRGPTWKDSEVKTRNPCQ